MIRSGFDHLHLRLLTRRLLAADRLYLVYSLVMVVKPLMVAERGIAPLDFALVGGLACVNILMVFKIDFLRKKTLTSRTHVFLELFMALVDVSLKTKLRTELLFAVCVVACENF